MIMNNKDFRKTNKKWSDDSIKDALLKKSCWGKRGYEIIIKSNMPYPSLRTLSKRINQIKFEPGTQSLIIEGLSNMLQNLDDSDLASYAFLSFIEINPK
jgi:Transposase protein